MNCPSESEMKRYIVDNYQTLYGIIRYANQQFDERKPLEHFFGLDKPEETEKEESEENNSSEMSESDESTSDSGDDIDIDTSESESENDESEESSESEDENKWVHVRIIEYKKPKKLAKHLE